MDRGKCGDLPFRRERVGGVRLPHTKMECLDIFQAHVHDVLVQPQGAVQMAAITQVPDDGQSSPESSKTCDTAKLGGTPVAATLAFL